MLRYCIILFIYGAIYVNSQYAGFGSCPTTAPMTGFDAKQFRGEWVVIKQYPILIELGNPKCNRHIYMTDNNGLKLFVMYLDSSNQFRFYFGNGTYRGANTVADFNIGLFPPATIQLQVLQTDYNNYATVYSCTTVAGGLGNTAFLFLLGRKRTDFLLDSILATNIVNAYSIPTSSLVTVNQSDCNKFLFF